MTHFSWRIAAALLLSLLVVAEAAANRITRVYRADGRPPADVFAHGFQGRGNLMSVLAHTLGESCEETDAARASIWVSTSSERDVAMGFAMGHIETIPGHGPANSMWIYTIRADHQYVSVPGLLHTVASAGYAGQSGYNAEHARTLEHLLRTTVMSNEREVITHYVSPRNIVSAVQVYFSPTDDIIEGQAVLNPAFEALDTAAVNTVAELQHFVPAASIRTDYESDPDSEGSCAMTCDRASSASTFSLHPAAASKQCRARDALTPMLLDLLLSSAAPWRAAPVAGS